MFGDKSKQEKRIEELEELLSKTRWELNTANQDSLFTHQWNAELRQENESLRQRVTSLTRINTDLISGRIQVYPKDSK